MAERPKGGGKLDQKFKKLWKAKVGPVPVPVLVIGLGALAIWYWRRNGGSLGGGGGGGASPDQSSDSAASDAQGGQDGSAGGGSVGGGGGYGYLPAPNYSDGSVGVAPPQEPETDGGGALTTMPKPYSILKPGAPRPLVFRRVIRRNINRGTIIRAPKAKRVVVKRRTVNHPGRVLPRNRPKHKASKPIKLPRGGGGRKLHTL